MNATLIYSGPTRRFMNILTVSFVLLFSSCATSVGFNRSTVVPAATGKVMLKKDRNDNYSVNVKIKNLAKPENLQTQRSTYIVWMDTEGNGPKNLGQLHTANGLFGGALKASLKTVTSFKPERFFVTAEDNANIEYPRSQRVLETGTVN